MWFRCHNASVIASFSQSVQSLVLLIAAKTALLFWDKFTLCCCNWTKLSKNSNTVEVKVSKAKHCYSSWGPDFCFPLSLTISDIALLSKLSLRRCIRVNGSVTTKWPNRTSISPRSEDSLGSLWFALHCFWCQFKRKHKHHSCSSLFWQKSSDTTSLFSCCHIRPTKSPKEQTTYSLLGFLWKVSAALSLGQTHWTASSRHCWTLHFIPALI